MSDSGSVISTDTNITDISSYSSVYSADNSSLTTSSSLISYDNGPSHAYGCGSSKKSSDITRQTYIRKLPYSVRSKLKHLLDPDALWRRVCSEVVDPDTQTPRYTLDDIKNFELSLSRATGSPTDDFLSDWGTQNVKVHDLLAVLLAAGVYDVANYVATQVLQEAAVYEATIIDSPYTKEREVAGVGNIDLMYVEPPSQRDDLAAAPTPTQQGKLVTKWPYHMLRQLTGLFDDRPLGAGGHRIGTGGFANVYWARGEAGEMAVKRLVSNSPQVRAQFITELEVLSQYEHDNLLSLLGYSVDGPELCLVYPYMCGGSLQDRLRPHAKPGPLSWSQRLNILIDTASGLQYLHHHENKLVHRDIKSANILLTSELTAVIGDFGICKLCPPPGDGLTTSVQTSHVIGTTPYMAPEAHRGSVSSRADIFALGVILLEVITGWPAYDGGREEADIISCVEECEDEDARSLVDQRLDLREEVVQRFLQLAKTCYAQLKKDRPDINHVLNELLEIKKCT